ncbi:MAG TPA: TonB-dependent receptor [Methylomirabilota bacterium]|nr:TonB-dependent receptor [Methylomirabilota bacterium]
MPVLAGGAAATDFVPSETVMTNADLQKLSGMSIEELMNTKVTILGPSETISKTPAAVSVVTADDIKRSGAQSISEALRLVPGMDVAQIDASQWAVSARGFNDEFANKLLVLQDGRSIYTPLFGGVLWDVQGTMMEDIDHIEVVRGPGATLWGANAVNGVINIITKSAQDTQGWLVNGGGGSQDLGFADARYGGKIGDNGYYRFYGTYDNHASMELPGDGDAHDSWQLARGGFRTDWTPAGDNLFTVQGDGYWGGINEVFTVYDPSSPTLSSTIQDDMQVSGANVLGRWTHTISDTADFKLQTYYDYTERDATRFINTTEHTFDLNFQNEFAVGERNKMIWGLGYRFTADMEKTNPGISFNPANQTLNLFSGFVQDEIALVEDRVSLTLGTKVEHNDYTGFEVEPGARLAWTPKEHQTVWASVSRAVRTPARTDEDVTLRQAAPTPPFPPGTTLTASGSTAFQSEELLAYEIGYRTVPLKNVSLDVAAFYNDYNRLGSSEIVSPFPPVATSGNKVYGDTYGVEVSATWRVMERWRLQPAYTYLKMNLHTRSGSTDTTTASQFTGESPENQFSIRSSLDLPKDVTFDTALRYVDNLPSLNVPSYFELDARLAWRINKHWEVSLVGQNLLHPQHLEFGPTAIQIQQTEIPRSVYGKISWQF